MKTDWFEEHLKAQQEIERLREACHRNLDITNTLMQDNMRLREALQIAGDRVERLAFKMPPPNPWTPQFVSLGQAISRAALQQKELEL